MYPFCYLLPYLVGFQCSSARVSTQWEENLNLTPEVLGIQSSESLQRILGLGLCESALSVCPLRRRHRRRSCWGSAGYSSLFMSSCSYVRFQFRTDFSLSSEQVCRLCVVVIYGFSLRNNARKILNFENCTFNLKNCYVS